MATPADIVRHHEPDPDENPWVAGTPPPPQRVEIVDDDPEWPAHYDVLAEIIRSALGPAALHLEHVGSTSVPGLAAKPVIDIDLTVADPADEAAYVPQLEAAGFELRIREPSWHQHRCFAHLGTPKCNLHVFGADCPESIRHRMFRDWLRDHPDDRDLYAAAKRASIDGGGHVMDYNKRKEPIIRAIYDRAFRAAGLL